MLYLKCFLLLFNYGKKIITPNSPNEVVFIKTIELEFDPENPRFYRLNGRNGTQQKVIEDMLDEEGAADLMASIGQKGYFAGEPLLVLSENNSAPYLVIEGNRRLAAVKLLNGEISPPIKRQRSITTLQQEAAVPPPKELPCLIYNDRKEILRYLGYRHITGIQEWDALSKAIYLRELRDKFYETLPYEEQFKSLAKDIGSKPDYVAKLLSALNLYDYAKDNNSFLGLPLESKDVEFSYITTALGYKNIYEWLGLKSTKDVESENLNEENLKQLFGWFFSKDQNGRTIIGESRNISDLSDIVKSDKAIAALNETKSIATAYLFTDGPNEALLKALNIALSKIQIAWRMLPEARELTTSHEDAANEIFNHARDTRNSIRSKLEDQ